jgi:glycosyltransferase involved in cell wall biosynthesis
MDCTRFACSAATGRFLYHDLLFREQHFEIIPNAIETQHFIFDRSVREVYRALLGIKDSVVLGTIGRMVLQKNHLFLIRIFDKIRRHIPGAKLLLIGNGPLAGEIQKQIQDMQLEQDIMCLGERTDVPCLLQAMDIFLLPSVFEGLPISCLEAQASGLPCILSDAITREAGWREQVCFLPLSSEELWVRECIRMIQTMGKYPERFCRDCPNSFPDIISESQKLLRIYKKRN